MSFEQAKWAQQTKMTKGMRSRSSCKAVFNALAHFADDETQLAWPCVATLVAYTELSKKAVTSALQELEKFGFIVDSDMRAGRTHQVKIFSLRFPNQDNVKGWSISTPSDNEEGHIDTSLEFKEGRIDIPSEDKEESIDTTSKNERGSDCLGKGVGLSHKEGSILPTIKSVNKSIIKSSREINLSPEDESEYETLKGLVEFHRKRQAETGSTSANAIIEQLEEQMARLTKPKLKIVGSA